MINPKDQANLNVEAAKALQCKYSNININPIETMKPRQLKESFFFKPEGLSSGSYENGLGSTNDHPIFRFQ